MTDSGKELSGSIRQFRKMFIDLSKLLQTVDELMRNEGWVYPPSDRGSQNNVVLAASATINYPERWMPYVLFRFYTKPNRPSILSYVSVLLDDDVDGEYRLEEPLVTAGFFDYGNKEADQWEAWWCKWHMYSDEADRKDDGSVISSYGGWKEEWKKEEQGITYPFEEFKVFARPLVELTTPEIVKAKITDELLKLLEVA
mgnify:CR=1 FL=1